MTKRDFFRIVIKLFALYSLILTVFNWFPSNFVYIINDWDLLIILGGIVFTMLSFIIFYFLINKTDWIIEVLNIDRGFDDDNIVFEKLDYEKILMLGIIVAGGLLFVIYLADVIQNLFLTFRNEVKEFGTLDTVFGYGPSDIVWFIPILNVIIGFILISYHKKVAKYLVKDM